MLAPQGSYPRVLVAIFGSLRGGPSAWHSLQQHVLRPNNADLALMIGEPPPDASSTLLAKLAKFVWTVPEPPSWEGVLDNISFALLDPAAPATPRPKGVAAQRGMRTWRELAWQRRKDGLWGGTRVRNESLKGSGAIVSAMRWHLKAKLLQHGLLAHYDWFVITRADHYYACEHQVRALDPRFVWVPEGEDYGGINDRHHICARGDVLRCLSILDSVLEQPDRYASASGTNPEGLLWTRWGELGLAPRVRRMPRVMFTVAAPGDATRWRRRTTHAVRVPSNGSTASVHLKYEREYVLSRRTCGLCNATHPHLGEAPPERYCDLCTWSGGVDAETGLCRWPLVPRSFSVALAWVVCVGAGVLRCVYVLVPAGWFPHRPEVARERR